ncbi:MULTISPECIES: class I adenylate-forming enzyme family protein [unclassified Variovorax]|uniref:class I adenylate-forming enzyme family protein n=1 Tax=unclassified Variovorax TaxID=663243 RepID=UPI00076D061D|nr:MULTISPECIES: class I adenylate-forming enzyme family protein [unclassified Variovorax]KWT98750.1 Long-chain-fatty-acid--CoA ligase [Variovorax sp. WDL1]PNG56187.1 Long-chain-fatty-acid--CoA ligase [Variovorax sp. B4]PNG57611.1 Long-chain-fatty-acid--CoA ligase [Variovorax sp. B2]VTV09976.1 Long-chain-fatty-acid--CoA ligase [Variovorax sp. WDL1]
MSDAAAAHLLEVFQARWTDPSRASSLALKDERRSYTYAELHEAVGRCAGWLHGAGVRHGDRVALAMARSAELAICILGVMAAGACPCPLEPRLGEEEARRRTRVAGIRWIVADAANAAEGEVAGIPTERRLAFEAVPRNAPFWTRDLAPESDGFLLFTSGSSGKPKGVLQNHRGLLTNALGVIRHTGLTPADRLLHIMPMHHTNGVNNQLLAPLAAGSAIVLAPRFKAEQMPELMAAAQPTILTGVPTMFARMLPLDFPPSSLASLRVMRCGSAPITEELHRRIEAKFGLPLVISYGLSEATCTSTMNPPERRKIGSVGTPLQGQSAFLRGADGERIAKPGVDGEICISGPSLMTGYLVDGGNGVAQSPGGELRTGDLGRFDEDGYLFITGRLKDVIIRGGENLSPHLIEEAIAAVPGVAACCVVGKAHADLGEVPVAVIVRQHSPEGAQLEGETIRCAVAARLSPIHQPAATHFVESLPENGTGKVDRRLVRESVAAL